MPPAIRGGRQKSAAANAAFVAQQKQLASDWAAAAARGIDPENDEAEQLAQRHYDGLIGFPGTPSEGKDGPPVAYVLGVTDMYAADPRFARNFGGQQRCLASDRGRVPMRPATRPVTSRRRG
jgi:hypothetical protein